MKALVTGGAGFIGSNLVDQLLWEGWDVIAIDNESANSNGNFFWNPTTQNIVADITDYKITRKFYNEIDVVFHLAAETRIQETIANPIRTMKTNVLGTSVVLQCSREAGVKRVVFSSTSAIYGRNSVPHEESQIADCLNPYSVSKKNAEDLCRIYTTLFGLETVILRYFNVYGEREPEVGSYAPVIGIFKRQKRNNHPLTVVGDGQQRRDFIHVNDVVRANILAACTAIDSKYLASPINIGSGRNYSILELAKMISNDIIYIDSRPGEMQETLADIKKAKMAINWSPQIQVNI